MQTIEINKHQYRIGRLDARRQWHVVRRLAPILASLGGTMLGQLKDGKKPSFDAVAAPIAERIASMPNEDMDYILTTCLAVCDRMVNGEPAPVQAPKTDHLMFPDIDMQVMLRLTIAVVEDNLGDFFTLAQPEQKVATH